MSHTYLLDLMRHLTSRLEQLAAGAADPALDPEERERALGRREALEDFQAFLCRHYTPKLPRRLRRAAADACPTPGRREAAGA